MVPGKAIPPRRTKLAEAQGNTTSGSGMNPCLAIRQRKAHHGKPLRRLTENVKYYSRNIITRLKTQHDSVPPATSAEETISIQVYDKLETPKRAPPRYGLSLNQQEVLPGAVQARQEMTETSGTTCQTSNATQVAKQPPGTPQQVSCTKKITNDSEETTWLPIATTGRNENPILTAVGSWDWSGRHLENRRTHNEAEVLIPAQTPLSSDVEGMCRHLEIEFSKWKQRPDFQEGSYAKSLRTEFRVQPVISNSSAYSDAIPEISISKRNPIPSLDANIDSIQEALKLKASLDDPALSLASTVGWVAWQQGTQPTQHRHAPHDKQQSIEKVTKSEGSLKQTEVPSTTKASGAAAGVVPCLSTIEEANSDAGCSAPYSPSRGRDENHTSEPLFISNDVDVCNYATSEYTLDATKSLSTHSKIRESTPATSNTGGPDSEVSEYPDTSDSELSSVENTTELGEDSLSLALQASHLDPKLHPFLITLKECVVFLVLECVSEWIASCSPNQDASDHNCGAGGASGSSSDRGRSSNDADNNKSGGKRSLDRSGSDRPDRQNGDDQDKRRKTDNNGSGKATGKKAQIFACPFLKRYPDEKWPRCQRGWPDIHRLKTHIYDVHTQRPYCGRCFDEFDDETMLQQHQQQDCELNRSPPKVLGITPSMHLKLKRRKGIQNKPADEYWEHVYKTIFPGVIDIPDPYWKGSDSIREALREPEVQAEIGRVLSPKLVQELQSRLKVPVEVLERIIPDSLNRLLRESFNPVEHGSNKPTLLQATIDNEAGPSQEHSSHRARSDSSAWAIPSSDSNKQKQVMVQYSSPEQGFSINSSLPQSSEEMFTQDIGFDSHHWASDTAILGEQNGQFPPSFDMETLSPSENTLGITFPDGDPNLQYHNNGELDFGPGSLQ
ncbi:hypothetical protein HJFPF1_13336 [Paramyrothecium foliicola]|nr:hypothetical protein HJFPF1_13336 [Paramyrothecium foliicola]